MSYKISVIATYLKAVFLQTGQDVLIENLLTDSRKLLFPNSSLFFALDGIGRNGSDYINDLYNRGVRNFVVSDTSIQDERRLYAEANFLIVKDVLQSLQTLATIHRHSFSYPVIGITGSNGKTIVKEWLYQLLNDDYNIIRNLKSYNSQTGVPLSVWRMNEDHTLGIFESGISQPNEMQHLQKIIEAEIGIVTFIGEAHAEGFTSLNQKIQEKLLLFKHSKMLVFCSDDEQLLEEVKIFVSNINPSLQLFSWSKKNNADLQINKSVRQNNTTEIECQYKGDSFLLPIPFSDRASVNNALTCCAVMLVLDIPFVTIIKKMQTLRRVEMRLELKQGKNNCSIINDSYSADLQSLAVALDFLNQQNQQEKRTVILSDILQSGENASSLYNKVAQLLSQNKVHRLIGIGQNIKENAKLFQSIPETCFYSNTESFLHEFSLYSFQQEIILLKGARVFQFEKINKLLEQKFHETLLEINLNALRHNLTVYKKMLQPGVKMMAMVKAFSYGSGSFEIANVLQHAGVDYLAVAYADEGVELRSAGIKLPVMVLNAEAAGFENMVKHALEPELYSFSILIAFISFLNEKNISNYPVHIKIDTGMHRLGFEENEVAQLSEVLHKNNCLKVVSVFSHLAASGSALHDNFTNQQTEKFAHAADIIESKIGHKVIRHIANSSAIYRHPQLQMNMIRLGIGLYGVDSNVAVQHQLQNVTTLKTTVAQIKHVKKGESIGYNRAAIAEKDLKIATVRIGYADGYPRLLSNGVGKMLVNGNSAAVIGNICMDMTMLDITGMEVSEGDEVIVFGDEPNVTTIAAWAQTISYEILTNISQRVKRVYFEE